MSDAEEEQPVAEVEAEEPAAEVEADEEAPAAAAPSEPMDVNTAVQVAIIADIPHKFAVPDFSRHVLAGTGLTLMMCPIASRQTFAWHRPLPDLCSFCRGVLRS